MRILYDSKLLAHKDPFGTLTPGEGCKLNIHIPAAVQATKVMCMVQLEGGEPCMEVPMKAQAKKEGPYEIFSGELKFEKRGLYFYYFHITHKTGSFRLFKQGDDTNMEAGSLWQVSCIPADFRTPDWASTRCSPIGSTSPARWT